MVPSFAVGYIIARTGLSASGELSGAASFSFRLPQPCAVFFPPDMARLPVEVNRAQHQGW